MYKTLSSTPSMANRKKKEVLDQIALSCHSAKKRHTKFWHLDLGLPVFITMRHKFPFIINYSPYGTRHKWTNLTTCWGRDTKKKAKDTLKYRVPYKGTSFFETYRH
jgi:hypothetical protein